MARLSVNEASEIAYRELKRISRKWKCEIYFSGLVDAGQFFVFGYRYKNEDDYWNVPHLPHIVVDAETGELLLKPKPLLGTEFKKQIDAGKRLEIPEEYRQ